MEETAKKLETIPPTMLSEVRSCRAKFVDELNYEEKRFGLANLYEEIETVLKPFHNVSKLSSLISSVSEELEELGYSIKLGVPQSYTEMGCRKLSRIPIVAAKCGLQVSMGFAVTKATKQIVETLRASSTIAAILIIAKPSESVKLLDQPPPKGIAKQFVLQRHESTPVSKITHTKPVAAEGKGKEGGKGGGLGRKGSGSGRPMLSSLRSESIHVNMYTRADARGKTKTGVRKLDWEAIDKYGNPIVSFDPGHPLFPKIRLALEQPTESKLRQAILEKLSTETSRIYERYRRAEAKSRGSVRQYAFGRNDELKLKDLALGCVQNGITPRQVLEYWHVNVQDFTHGDLRVPTIAFLSSPRNLDRVACSTIGFIPEPKKAPTSAESRNSFSATDGLDVRLRPALERGGFDTTPYNDRYLLSVQHTSMAIAAGKNVFVVDGKFGRMIRFAAENLYN